MSVLEATFDPDAAVTNVSTPAALRQPAFHGPQDAEAQPAGGSEGASDMGGAAGFDSGPDTAFIDIGAASFGQAQGGAVAIIGTDEREQVTQTTQYLWRAIASLRITARDGSQWIGTGWFICPRTLITAGHCVFIKGSGDPN